MSKIVPFPAHRVRRTQRQKTEQAMNHILDAQVYSEAQKRRLEDRAMRKLREKLAEQESKHYVEAQKRRLEDRAMRKLREKLAEQESKHYD